jgi:hypothetical protein
VLREVEDGWQIDSGLRVNASPVGGARYHELLWHGVGDPEALGPRQQTDAGGLPWGRVVRARAAADAEAGDWFCPPRPLTPAHFDTLRHHLATARESSHACGRLRALAAFHQRFIQAHAFACGNQSLAMNLVNHVLSGALGAGIPHLILDHLALRASPEAYAELFARAVATYLEADRPPAERYSRLAARCQRGFELAEALGREPELRGARALAEENPEGARDLLLLPAPPSPG